MRWGTECAQPVAKPARTGHERAQRNTCAMDYQCAQVFVSALVMPSNLGLPPVVACRGTRPTVAQGRRKLQQRLAVLLGGEPQSSSRARNSSTCINQLRAPAARRITLSAASLPPRWLRHPGHHSSELSRRAARTRVTSVELGVLAACSTRPKWCAPQQASKATTQGGSWLRASPPHHGTSAAGVSRVHSHQSRPNCSCSCPDRYPTPRPAFLSSSRFALPNLSRQEGGAGHSIKTLLAW